MPSASTVYQRRSPGDDTLYRIVRDHFETFRAHAAGLRDLAELPRMVEEEFKAFLRPAVGWRGAAFAGFHCAGCEFDRLVKAARALAGLLGGRRMAERAARDFSTTGRKSPRLRDVPSDCHDGLRVDLNNVDWRHPCRHRCNPWLLTGEQLPTSPSD